MTPNNTMKSGVTGKILRVNLSTASIEVEQLPESFYRMYPGGKAMAGYFLLKELDAHVEPLSPGNLLVLADGLLTGSPVSTANRYTAAAHSPLTGAYGESEASGYWGPELRNAGWDAILLTGKSESPTYLSIQDNHVSLKPASHLWGQPPHVAQELIRRENADKNMRVLQIGIGGEKLVRFAAITNELRHFNGRNGIGAVMGSKNLKAVAIRGTGRYSRYAYDTGALGELGRQIAAQAKEHPLARDTHDRGTPGMFETLNTAGILPTHNFRAGSYDSADSLKWAPYESGFLTGRGSCYACSVRCKREIAVDGRTRSSLYDGPEYEAMAGFGSNCLNADLNIVMKANELCNIYALDAISTAMAITFAMECFESGLIGRDDTDGIELRFGNGESILPMIEKIAHREGIGDLLAEGTVRAARKIGGGAEAFPIEVKGQELPMHDPRGKTGIGIGFAVSEGGADHLVSFHDTTLVNPESLSFQGARALGMVALPARDLTDQKVMNYFIGERWSSFEKCAGFCYFGPAPRSFIQAETVPQIVNAATGWDVSLDDLLEMGERATNLARLFNLREGFSPRDDRLPERMFMPSEAGPLAGKAIDRGEFERALAHLYELKDWDLQTGMPSPKRLHQLGLDWTAAATKG